MGKTLSSYFSGFEPTELAQFYIHSQIPASAICQNYFRITDVEAIKSIFGKPCGRVFGGDDIQAGRKSSSADIGAMASLYQRGRKRTPIIYLVRNLWWKLSRWNSKSFRSWVDDFHPDCVFFASGDYAFMYDIAYQVAKSRGIPLYISCMDDYYLNNKNENRFLGKFQHSLFLKSVNKAVDYAKLLFCICENMSRDYSTLFHKDCITVHTPSTINAPLRLEKSNQISYLGNLGYNRDKQLIEIGRCLKKLGRGIDHIDVYSAESRPEIIKQLNEDNGIVFHKAVGAEEVLQIMGKSIAVIHTESFDEEIQKSVRYSVSTKIADSLASGTCIFAYGPAGLASIDYLQSNDAAICCTNRDNLLCDLRDMLDYPDLRARVIQNALHIAEENHSRDNTPTIIKKMISQD